MPDDDDKQELFLYHCFSRPPGRWTLPAWPEVYEWDSVTRRVEIGGESMMSLGYVYYCRRLTPEEAWKFDLTPDSAQERVAITNWERRRVTY